MLKVKKRQRKTYRMGVKNLKVLYGEKDLGLTIQDTLSPENP